MNTLSKEELIKISLYLKMFVILNDPDDKKMHAEICRIIYKIDEEIVE